MILLVPGVARGGRENRPWPARRKNPRVCKGFGGGFCPRPGARLRDLRGDHVDL